MMQISCPFCGPRELPEFSFHKTVADPQANPFEEVYLRENRVDYSAEHWQHFAGCRAWLLVVRNPSTGEVVTVSLAGSGGT
jgi:heterotetrameric sarcosine oxidase delta subunit